MTSPRRFPPPWQVEQTPGGFKVIDASGQALVYVYARDTREQAEIAKVPPEETSVSGVAGRGGGGALPTSEVSTEPSRSDFFGATPLAHRLEKKQQID